LEIASGQDVDHVDHVLAVVFTADIYFANAGVFRRELHLIMAAHHDTRHIVIDAAAIANIDYNRSRDVESIGHRPDKDSVSVSIARATADVRGQLKKSGDKSLSSIPVYDSVDAAVSAFPQ